MEVAAFEGSGEVRPVIGFFEHEGIRFRYREEGRGLPFVFQHGLGADLDQVFDLVRPMEGVRLIGFDSRAHGETAPVGPEEKLSVEQSAADLGALLGFLQVERAVVGGISMGAAIALHFALENPECVLGLVLSRPAWLDEPRGDTLKVFPTLASYIRRYGAFEGAKRYQETDFYQQVRAASPDNARSLLGQFAHPRAEETVARLERIPAYVPKYTRADWKRLSMPVLVLANSQDEIHPFAFGEVLAREIPNARLVEITPKSRDQRAHQRDVQEAMDSFLRLHFL